MARPNNESAIQGKIAGLRQAKAAFQALPEAMRDRLLVATETTLSEIVRHAKGRILSSPSVQTRTLYNAIGYTLNKKSGKGRAGIQNVTSTVMFAHMGGITRKIKIKGTLVPAKNTQGQRLMKPVKYGPKVEFGTRFMKEEPFMIPAAQSQEGPYLDRVMRAGKEVEKDLAAIGLRNA